MAPKAWVRARGAAMVLGATLESMGAGGCSTTRSIWPDQLPRLAEDAADNPGGDFVVQSTSGEPLKLHGYLDTVIVERTGGDEDIFRAPIRADMRDARLWVWGSDDHQAYTPQQIASVRVRMSDNDGMLTGGVALTVFGGLATLGGAAALVAASGDSRDGGLVALFVGAPLFVLGSGLASPGIALMVMGMNKPDTGLPPKYRPAPPGPGATGAGVRIQF